MSFKKKHYFEGEKQIECRTCGSKSMQLSGKCRELDESSSQLFPERRAPVHATGELYRCGDCGLGQRIPCLTEREVAVLYESMENDLMDYDFKSNGAWVKAADILKKRWNESDKPFVLDIGAYEGRFLQGLPKGWQKFAVEPSQKAQAVLNKRGIEVVGKFLANTSSGWHGKFDSVCMFDVVEHLHKPDEGLLNALKFVKPGGSMLISTGDVDAWTWRWFGPDHWYLESPLHISFASEKFFRTFCHKYGLHLSGIYRISHRINDTRQKIEDLVAACYFVLRKKGGGWRIPQRLIQSLPHYRKLMHKKNMPCTFYLKDHMLVEVARPSDASGNFVLPEMKSQRRKKS